MYRVLLFLFAIILLFTSSFQQDSFAQKIETENYSWKNVQTVGGGFVTGIIFHPTAENTRYCRTDMGGAYAWDAKSNRWKALLDWLSYEDRNLMGVESIALDPNDPDKLYLACGTYTNQRSPNGAILYSSDRGKTFKRSNVPFKMGGNENGRGNGERMMVDPNNGDIIYLGTRKDGLWKSIDGANSWTKVNSFPDVSETIPENLSRRERFEAMRNQGSGIIFILFDPSSKKGGKSQVIIAGVSLKGRENLFISKDAGNSWKAIKGQETDLMPTHGLLSTDGWLYITYGDSPGPSEMSDGALRKFKLRKNKWIDITPEKRKAGKEQGFGFAAISIDGNDPSTLLLTSYHRYSEGGDEIYRSLDGGKSWNPIRIKKSEFLYDKAPYLHHTGIHWMFDIEIDPLDSEHALFTTGYGGHETFNLGAADLGEKVIWEIMSTGIEETVPLDLLSPPEGAQIVTAIGDYCGFILNDLDSPPPQGCFINPHFGNTDGISCAELHPEIMVRVGIESASISDENISYSLDGGKNWHPTKKMPEDKSMHGHIAVNSDGSAWIWTPQRSAVFVTHDQGESWKKCLNIPGNIRVIADRIDPSIFYGLDLRAGMLYTSKDKGLSFVASPLKLENGFPRENENRGDSRGGQDRLYATPGKTSDLWIAAYDGLYHSSNAGKDFYLMNSINQIHAFGFGKAAPQSEHPSLYLVGTINGIRGIFRSDNKANSWIKINDEEHEYGLILQITGDPKKYGRVYVGTHGRGTIYGDPNR